MPSGACAPPARKSGCSNSARKAAPCSPQSCRSHCWPPGRSSASSISPRKPDNRSLSPLTSPSPPRAGSLTSCRNRACPQCNGLARERWLQRTRARLLDCAHWHVVFTIPHQLNALWQLNTAPMMDALFAAARDTLLELLSDPRHLGAQAGIQLALHTWTRTQALHPHVHALVSDGGMHQGQWVSPRRSHFLPAKVVMLLFRGKLLDALRKLHQDNCLRRPDQISPERLTGPLNYLGRRLKWNVRVCQRYAHGRGVAPRRAARLHPAGARAW